MTLRRLIVIFVTFARLPLAAAAAALVFLAAPGGAAAWIALGLLVAMELTDLLDGVLARRLGVAGLFGELFDPYCDSVARLVTYFGLASAALCPWWLVLVMALRDISVAYARIVSTIRGGKVSSRLSGKLKAVVQGAGAIALVGLLATAPQAAWRAAVGPVVAWAVAAVTAWSGIDYFLAAVARKKTSPSDD